MPSLHDSEMNEPTVGLKGGKAGKQKIRGKIRITHVHTVYPVLSLSLSHSLYSLLLMHLSIGIGTQNLLPAFVLGRLGDLGTWGVRDEPSCKDQPDVDGRHTNASSNRVEIYIFIIFPFHTRSSHIPPHPPLTICLVHLVVW